jgi:NADH:ubiquinone oxidoreductase subunit C
MADVIANRMMRSANWPRRWRRAWTWRPTTQCRPWPSDRRIRRSTLFVGVRTLRDDPKLAFVNMIDICGVDYPARERRFDVVYHFLSPTQNARAA